MGRRVSFSLSFSERDVNKESSSNQAAVPRTASLELILFTVGV